MNVLVRDLGDVCREHLLAEKWVLAPSRRAGHAWLVAVARSGQPVINAHVKTLSKLALDLAGPLIAERKLEFLSAQQCSLLVDRVMQRLRKPGEGYLLRLSPSVRLSEKIFRAIEALRMAGLNSGDLHLDRFEVDVKGREVQAILREYLKELEEHTGRDLAGKLQHRKGLDQAGVVELAIERLQSKDGRIASDVLVLVPEDIDVSHLEHQLLDALPRPQQIRLRVDQPATDAFNDRGSLFENEGGSSSDARLLRWLSSPAQAPPPCADGSARIFRAVGEVNEIRGVLRRCLAEKIPLDQVEVLCTDVSTYIPLIYDMFAALEPDEKKTGEDGTSLDRIPVTFHEGIPARKFRPGRALVAWLAWVRDDFPQSGLIGMIQEGLLNIPDVDRDAAGAISFGRLAETLRTIGIGFGRDRYEDKLRKHEEAGRRRRSDPRVLRDEEGEVAPGGDQSLEQRLKAVGVLKRLVTGLLEVSPRPGDEAPRIFELAQTFLDKYARKKSQLDNYASDYLIRRIKEFRGMLDSGDAVSHINARAWLAALPEEASVGGLGPLDGCVHVAHVLAGGHTGRPYTFIVGLDDGRFPGAGLQDPILLDEERRGLSGSLPTAGGDLANQMKRIALLLARLRDNVTLSYACHSLADDREMFPSPVILSAFRILSGEHDGDQAALNRWLPPPESFAPESPEQALTESEWWFWRMSGTEEVIEPRGLVAARYPHLGRGFVLKEERESDRFTIFDGWIPAAGAEIDPTSPAGPPVSASQLETLGQCPLKYFFRYVLKIGLPDELTSDPEVWLNPLSRGSLLHEVFERFVMELIARGDVPEFARDEPRLMKELNERIEWYRAEIPPPNEAVFQQEERELKRTARIFLRGEDEYCRETGNRPLFLEVSIGLPSKSPETVLATDEPVKIRLPDGRSLQVRSRLDRIDQVHGADANVFAIWDYKTGGTWKYAQDSRPFWQGRVVQHVLSLLVMNARLKALGDAFPGARAESFGFFFPSKKGEGERITYTSDELKQGTEVLGRLAGIAANGAFLATTRDDLDCGFCDYRGVCGDVAAVAAASVRKLNAPANAILEPYRNLRDVEASE